MLQEDSVRKANRSFAASSALEIDLPQSHDPQEGARLVRAFLRINDPEIRLAILEMVEKLGSEPIDF